MKAFTDLEQSKKLSKILPLESADMFWLVVGDTPRVHVITDSLSNYSKWENYPCWSLAALIDVLPKDWWGYTDHYFLEISKMGDISKPNEVRYFRFRKDIFDMTDRITHISHSAVNLVDACVNMIITLHDHNLLKNINMTQRKVQDVSSKIEKLWTIQDAKEGDVLATNNGDICLFDGTVEDGKYPFAYCGLTRYGFEVYDRTLPFTHDYVSPATQRQYDFLFKKMKENGYEWDVENKKLKKIKQKPTDYENANIQKKDCTKVEPKFKIGNEIQTKNEESLTITRIDQCGYWSNDLFICGFDEECMWGLVNDSIN